MEAFAEARGAERARDAGRAVAVVALGAAKAAALGVRAVERRSFAEAQRTPLRLPRLTRRCGLPSTHLAGEGRFLCSVPARYYARPPPLFSGVLQDFLQNPSDG